ncbi:hypothetical protein [Streptomyces sp. NPDC052496]|uniref:RICIN domain-containing protein n=1 Tax=Streptomyces sp. NPDC052496 TaxID=3154951 RepID=UPI00344A2362
MERQRRPEPREIHDLHGFIVSLRQLKKHSGLSFRALEQRALAAGDPLSRSGMSSMLAHDVLPRTEALLAFVRACGDGGRQAEWLSARERITGTVRAPAPDRPPGDAPQERGGAAPAAAGRLPRRLKLLAVALAIMVASVTATALVSRERGAGDFSSVSGVPSAAAPSVPTGWVRIRVADDPRLCLSDGRVADRRHTPLVAVQRPCDRAAPPNTLLERAGKDLYRIQWHHPDYGKGCLQVLTGGRGAGLLEPRDDCAEGSLFRIEPSGDLDKGRYVLHVDGQGCVGIKDASTAAGTEAVMGRCVGKGRQIFLISPAN